MWTDRRGITLLFMGLLWMVGGCGGGSVHKDSTPTPPQQKAVYEGPSFGDNEDGGVGYTNTNMLVRPPDQNNGVKGTINGALTTDDPSGDGWLYDRYTFTAIESGSRTVEVRSDAFDAVLAVFRVYPDGFWEYLGFDDDGGGNRNARFTVNADRNAVYVVTVTSYNKGATGNYAVLLEPGLSYAATRKIPPGDFGRPHDRHSIIAKIGE